MPLAAYIVAALVFGYLVGGIPWALIIGKRFYGVDPRQHGSGNLGATNVFRTLGARAAIATLLLDATKGSVAVAAVFAIVPEPPSDPATQWTAVCAIVAAVTGHAFSPYIGFKGGKGVATSAGGLFIITPLAAIIELLVFVAVVASTRMVSLGSVIIAILYPLLTLWFYGDSLPYVVTSFVLAALVLWLHRGNIVRIARGQEPRVSFTQREESASDSGRRER